MADAEHPRERGNAGRGDAPTPGIPPGMPCASDGDQLELAIPSDVSQIERVVGVVVERCTARHYPRRACALNVPVALTEALANAIVSGNGEDAAKCVRVRACVDDRQLVLEVHDEGRGFDLGAERWTPDDGDAHERENGRGLFLMRRLMDRVEQYRTPGDGNVVRMTLHRSA